MTVYVTYDPDSKNTISDGEARSVAGLIDTLCALDGSDSLIYANSNVFHILLTKIAQGLIDHKQIRFRYQDKIITPNKFGAITDWPKGFCDLEINEAEKRLMAQIQRRTEEKTQ